MDISQKRIRAKIVTYLILQNRDTGLISIFKEGHCNGLTVLTAYACYLATVPNPTQQQRDDWEWLKNIQTRLDEWDDKLSSLTTAEKNDIERFIYHVEFIQNIDRYIPDFGQSSIELFLEDTQHRHLQFEYSIGGLFTAKQFLTPTYAAMPSLIDEILQYDKRIILVQTSVHTMNLFRDGDQIHFHNPNCRSGRKTFSLEQKKELIDNLFHTRGYQRRKAAPFGFRIFTFEETLGQYRSPDVLLSGIKDLHRTQTRYANHASAMHIAACVGSLPSLEYYASRGADIDALTSNHQTPLLMALKRRLLPVATWLVSRGANINQGTEAGETPLNYAAKKKQIKLLVALLENPQNATPENMKVARKYLNSRTLYRALNEKLKALHTISSDQTIDLKNDFKPKPAAAYAQSIMLFKPKVEETAGSIMENIRRIKIGRSSGGSH